MTMARAAEEISEQDAYAIAVTLTGFLFFCHNGTEERCSDRKVEPTAVTKEAL